MDLIRFLAQRVFLPLSRLREGFDCSAIVRELQSSQFLSLDELRDRQFAKIKILLKESYENVPYYRG